MPNRRRIVMAALPLLAAILCTGRGERSAAADVNADKVERWGLFEISLSGPKSGNPFVDVELTAEFRQGKHVVNPRGFYDGDGTYRIRFMPEHPGDWVYRTKSNRPELDGQTGRFQCVEPSPDNHGPVQVWKTHHFRYADGTP